MIGFDYPLLDIFFSILYFFAMVIWFFAVASVIIDIFRSHDLSGIAKAAWFVFVLFLPIAGLLAYLIVRGSKMQHRAMERAEAQDADFRKYVQQVSGATPADELTKLVDLRERGGLTDAEFEQQKAAVLQR